MPAEKQNIKPMHGPGPRGPRGPRPKINNPGKLFARLMKYILANYGIHCAAVIVCIVITVLASVQGTLFMRTLIDEYILPLMRQGKSGFFESRQRHRKSRHFLPGRRRRGLCKHKNYGKCHPGNA